MNKHGHKFRTWYSFVKVDGWNWHHYALCLWWSSHLDYCFPTYIKDTSSINAKQVEEKQKQKKTTTLPRCTGAAALSQSCASWYMLIRANVDERFTLGKFPKRGIRISVAPSSLKISASIPHLAHKGCFSSQPPLVPDSRLWQSPASPVSSAVNNIYVHPITGFQGCGRHSLS